MKKSLSLGLLMLFFIGCVSSCGKNKHNFEEAYSHNETHHWQKCQDEGCEEKQNEAEHTWVESSRTAPSCTEAGVISSSCSVCGATKEETIDALGHNYGELHAKVDATETTKGNLAYYECSTCGKFFDADKVEKTWAEIELPTTGHTLTLVPGTATAFAAGIKEYYVCSGCGARFFDEEGTLPVNSDEELIDPIKSITVTEALDAEVDQPVTVRGVVLGAMSNNDYIELLIKDLENDNIIAFSLNDEDVTPSSINYLVNGLERGQVIAATGTRRCNTDKIGGQNGKPRIAGDSIEISEMTASYKINVPENVPVATTTQELDEILKGDNKWYSYIKLSGPIYGYFTGANGSVRFWLGENNNKDKLCTETAGGSALTAFGTSSASRARPLISMVAVNSNLGKSLESLLGFDNISLYSSYTKYFTFEGDMYVMCFGGNIWSAHFLPLFEEDVVAHDSCAKFAVKHEASELTLEAHGNIEYYQCSYCDKCYTDAACTQEITLAETVIHNYIHHDAIAVGCENDGLKEHYTCSLCDNKFLLEGGKYVITTDEVVITKLDHNYGDLIAEVLPTTEATGMKAHYECDRCHKVFDTDKVETTVQDLTIEKISHVHTFTTPVAGQEATCNVNGWKECYQCSFDGCGAIAATLNGEQATADLDSWKSGEGLLPHHDFRHVEASVPTCSKAGNVEYWFCADCDIYYKTEAADKTAVFANLEETVISALGHNYGENAELTVRVSNTEFKTIKLCTVCGHYVDQSTGAEYEGTIEYAYLRAKQGTTFVDGDVILMGNGEGYNGPGTKLAYSYYTSSDSNGSGNKNFSADDNNAEKVTAYDSNNRFTLIQGTGENANYFRLKTTSGKEIGTGSKVSNVLGYGNNSGSGAYWSLEVVEDDNCHIYAPTSSNVARYITVVPSNYYGVGKQADFMGIVAVYVNTAILTPVAD